MMTMIIPIRKISLRIHLYALSGSKRHLRTGGGSLTLCNLVSIASGKHPIPSWRRDYGS